MLRCLRRWSILKYGLWCLSALSLAIPSSVSLYDVPFNMALRAILKSNGCTAQRHDNVIFVTKAVEQPGSATRDRPTSMRTFRLNYANIPEAAEMV